MFPSFMMRTKFLAGSSIVDEQQVGERAFLDDAQFAWIRISFPRQRQQFGVC